METDICSAWAYAAIKESGYLAEREARHLAIFSEAAKPITAREAGELLVERFKEDIPDTVLHSAPENVSSSISSLTKQGFLRKYDRVKSPCNKLVNRWIYTGRKNPLPYKEVTITCNHCSGKGQVTEKRYIQEPESNV